MSRTRARLSRPEKDIGSPRAQELRLADASRGSVSHLTVNRVSLYLRSLRQLTGEGVSRVSSEHLSRICNLSAAQVRKDLAQFGEFGVRGVGYDVPRLEQQLARVLQLDRVHNVVIYGMGNLGTALARFPAFNGGSFQVVAGFDRDPAKIGSASSPIPVFAPQEVPRVVRETSATMAILAVPASSARAGYALLAEAGVRAVLNFAPVVLPAVAGCRVKNVDLRVPLEELAFYDQPAR